MKPRTVLQKKVWSLYQTLRPVTQKQMDWGAEHAPQHHCLHNPRTHKNVCMSCGYVWYDTKSSICPNCGRHLSVSDRYLKRTFEDYAYFDVVQKVEGFMVVRVFFVFRKVWRHQAPHTFIREVIQHWINEKGEDTVIARSYSMNFYYANCPFALYSDLSIKGKCHGVYSMDGDCVYPGFRKTALLGRNGLKSSFHGQSPRVVIRGLLTDNRFETLWKLGYYRMARYYANSPNVLGRYWKQIIHAHRIGYRIDEPSVWIDYLELLEHFGKDIRSPKYIFPEDYHAEHDRLVARRNREMEELRRRQERERRAEEQRRKRRKLAVFRKKAKYFGISFGNRELTVIVLSSIGAYKHEGDALQHCVYSNAYYGKEDSLILSARKKSDPDKPIETIELSLSDGSILQCYGKYNQPTKYHKTIMNLVSRNASRFVSKS